MSTFVFDLDNVQLFVDRWMAEVGNIYRGQKYNGWALFNDQRELLDVYITDVADRWVDFTTNPKDHEFGAWEILIDRARLVGATNIINVHTHPAGEPSGPCDGFVDGFFTGGVMAVNALSEGTITLRGSVILNDDELDGMLWAERSDQAEPFDKAGIARQLIAAVSDMPLDPTVQRIMPVLEKLAAGKDVSMQELIDAIKVLEDDPRVEPVERIDPLRLPPMRLGDSSLLN